MTLASPPRSTLARPSTLFLRGLLAAGLTLAAPACTMSPPMYTVPPPPGADTPLDQPGRGAEVYAQTCASCHGEHGEGTEGHVALIGAAALPKDPPVTAKTRKGKLVTARDLFAFVKSEMPPLAPGSLDDAEAWAVVAHLLKENGVDLRGKDLGEAQASTIALHR